MIDSIVPDWTRKVVFSEGGPQPQVLFDDGQLKVVLAGLQPGQTIPPHPEGRSVYHFLEGKGVMTIDDQPVEVGAGMTLVLADGTVRGMQAETRLAFLATRLAATGD
jgi:quercetin dioxygenase-like cupin family protein